MTASTPPANTAERERIKADFVRRRGTWGEAWDAILRFDPAFLHAYTDFSDVSARKGALDPKTRELMFIAVDAAATHLYLPGVEQHVRGALAAGASAAEIMEVIELTTSLGIHAMNVGMPILLDVLRARGALSEDESPLTEDQRHLKDEFIEKRGYWNAFWEPILVHDPEIFATFLRFSAVPWETGTLAPRVKEFVYIAFDCAATHLYTGGLRLHMEKALDYGAEPAEIIAVMEIASCIGIHAATTGAPILARVLDETTENGSAR
jgi:alkylhydroperoxidase/carboxymuconolactone decarboxylase family protein YurZ